jgi:hypothetical protein
MTNEELKQRYLDIVFDVDDAEMEDVIQEARARLQALRANDPLESYYAHLLLDLHYEGLLEDM